MAPVTKGIKPRTRGWSRPSKPTSEQIFLRASAPPRLHVSTFKPLGSVPFSILVASRYTEFMSIFRDIAGIAKGMSVTFREMFKPTIVENYPDGTGPMKGAMFHERFRRLHVLQRA